MNKIDWSAPIEAVHTDGRVVAVKVACGPDKDGDYGVEPMIDGRDCFRADGSRWKHDDGWHIRNVVDTDTVAVKRKSRAEWNEFVKGYDPSGMINYEENLLQKLGLIKPDPTFSERFKSDNPQWEQMPRLDLLELALAWAKEQEA